MTLLDSKSAPCGQARLTAMSASQKNSKTFVSDNSVISWSGKKNAGVQMLMV